MINLLLVIHNHQPVGNFEHVFKQAFKDCYWPLLETLSEFPSIKITLHHSGPLLDFALANEPNYLASLISFIKRGQVEPLGGGYYEPILAVIPPQDAAGQIEMMKAFWREHAGCEPRGIWTTERIWEPTLAGLLNDNKVEYTILDDEHFRAAGIMNQEVTGYYLTERHGKKTAIFASDKTLRYFIPFKTPEDVMGHLLWLSGRYDNSCITYGDDGEKFGLWPGTHEWVVKKGWLKKFFALLTENAEKVRTETVCTHLDSHKPEGKVYLPTCSYHEMGEWAMPPTALRKMEELKEFLSQHGKWDDAKTFIRGGYWDNFLTKYPEANYMHKRMIWVSGKASEGRGTSDEGQRAKTALYRAQCNCAYWHGLFGGLYLNYLRHAIWKNLIEAENIIDKSLATSHKSLTTAFDIDCDGSDEVIMKTGELIAVIKPNAGASLIELSHRKSGLNLQDVLARREEAYHKKSQQVDKPACQQAQGATSIHNINKEIPDGGNISYDEYSRYSFIDRIDNKIFAPQYKIISTNDGAKFEAEPNGLKIKKSFQLSGSALKTKYHLKWGSPLPKDALFSVELNLSLLAGHDESRYFILNGKRDFMDIKGSAENIDKLSMADEYFNFNCDISTSKKMNLERYPVYTVSQSESGFDLLYQGSCIMWKAFVPNGGKELEFEICLNFEKTR